MNDLVRDWTSPQPRLSYLDHGISSGTFYKRAWKSNFVGRRSRTLPSTLRWRFWNHVFGFVVGSQVKQLFQDSDFKNTLNAAGRRAWDAFEKSVQQLFGKWKIRNLRRTRGGAAFLTTCLGVQHETPLGFFPGKYGRLLLRARWMVPSEYIPKGKNIQR